MLNVMNSLPYFPGRVTISDTFDKLYYTGRTTKLYPRLACCAHNQ